MTLGRAIEKAMLEVDQINVRVRLRKIAKAYSAERWEAIAQEAAAGNRLTVARYRNHKAPRPDNFTGAVLFLCRLPL
jgi:hypothetical protein